MTSSGLTADHLDLIPHVPVAIVGGGPGGTGPLLAAAQQGRLSPLLETGVTIFEAGDSLVAGALGRLAVNSDTLASSFLEVLDRDPEGWFQGLGKAPETTALRGFDGAPAPLPIVGQFLAALGERLAAVVNSFPRSSVRFGESVSAAIRVRGGYLLAVQRNNRTSDGDTQVSSSIVHCKKLILATGGYQDLDEARQRMVRGQTFHHGSVDELLGGVQVPVATSGAVLNEPSGAIIRSQLRKVDDPQVTILGGSHSAFSAAWSLLRGVVDFGPGGVELLFRNPPKPFFADREAATSAGYLEVASDDICPLTKRVFRLAGLRFDGRELLMKTMQLGGHEPDERFVMGSLDDPDLDLRTKLRNSDLVIPAFGYRARALPIVVDGGRVALLADHGGPLVNDSCQVIDVLGKPVPGVYGIGLASGFVPSGHLGGEPSFRGQTNGYWLYQNGVGEIILDQIETRRSADQTALVDLL